MLPVWPKKDKKTKRKRKKENISSKEPLSEKQKTKAKEQVRTPIERKYSQNISDNRLASRID